MGVTYNNRIVTDGLVLCLDAASKRSYPGTGTTWTDLKGGNSGTLTNGPTFSSDNGGSIVFDGTNDWLDINGYRPDFSYSNGQEFSVEVWFKTPSGGSIGLACERQGGLGWVWAARNVSSNFIFSWWGGSGWSDLSSQIIEYDKWNMANMVYNSSTNYMMFYLNGQYVGQLGAGTSFNDTDDFSVIRWDNASSGYGNVNNVAAYRVYNRALSADEIRRNYLSTKERYL